jgi:hypothetical protein
VIACRAFKLRFPAGGMGTCKCLHWQCGRLLCHATCGARLSYECFNTVEADAPCCNLDSSVAVAHTPCWLPRQPCAWPSVSQLQF